jgi:hypothetical protein
MENEMSREDYVSALQTGVRTITFTKKDGTERVMKATLQESVVPATSGARTAPANNLVVFDTEKQGWRSVIIENIKSFQ